MDEITRNFPKTFDRASVKVRYLLVLTALAAVAAVGYTFLTEAGVSAQGREETSKVEVNESVLPGGTTGTMEICKEQQLPVSAANNMSKQIFHFVVTGATSVGTAANPVRVQVGSCSTSFDVTAGPQTVKELNAGTLVTPANGTFIGNFELIEVSNLTPTSTSTLGLVNLSTRVASVNIAEGGVSAKITLRFTNRKTITGFIEICKRAARGIPGDPNSPFNPAGANPVSGGDPDVTGFFQYTIQGIYTVNQQNPDIRVLQVFTIPAGQCSGPIVVSGGTTPTPGNPRRSSVIVTEFGRPGFFVESAEIIPGDRLTYGPELGLGVDAGSSHFNNPGGAFVEVTYLESANQADETLIIFSNRSNPGRLKVCKIAGPGIPINTLFRFTVSGIGATNAAAPQFTSYGPVTKTFDLRAGDPAQGGSCDFIQGFGANAPGYNQFQSFVNGTPVSVVENGLSPNNTVPQNSGQLRASRITQFGSAFTNTTIAGFSPNPDLVPAADYVARAAVFARAAVVEVGFANFRFNPSVLKICKIAGSPSLLGTSFNFTVALVSPVSQPDSVPLFPPFLRTVSVIAGPAAQGGNCTFVDGGALQGGTFNQGATITITESASSSFLSSITCPTCGTGGLAVDLLARRATLSGSNGILPGINAVTFTNQAIICRGSEAVGDRRGAEQTTDLSRPECSRTTRYDFDGDRKADPAIFTPSDGRWTIAASAENYRLSSGIFGLATDKLVPADYNGDGKTDLAIWRPSNGNWYFNTGTDYQVHTWGEAGDIPLTGDYDGDGKSDFAVWRPSNATMYIRHSSQTFRTFQFGLSTDKPYARDFDGDGRTDLAMLRNGTWYIQNSTAGFRIYQFGQPGDMPVPADYDGDGAADLAVYRNGTWYTLSATAYTVRQYGSATDVPVPADYDGDGKTDIAIFRPTDGRWLVRYSGIVEGSFLLQLGTATDISLQSLQ